MTEERLMAALGRIDEALARVEAVATAPSVAAPDGAFLALQSKHEALRSETRAAIADLDALIAATKGN